MPKLIRPTYPKAFSMGLLLLIFILSAMLSQQIFNVPFHGLDDNKSIYFGMVLVGIAVITMVMIIWEEFLFPIRVKEVNGGLLFRNRRSKLRAQVVMYCTIPAIFGFIYFKYDVNLIRFIIWAGICIIAPVVEKIVSGINNYNDFLKLTKTEIEYKNNEKEGCFKTKDIQSITVIRDERKIIEKVELLLTNKTSVIIDLDEMELDAFFDSIDMYIETHYQHLLNESRVATA